MAWIASLAQDGCDFSRLTGPSVAVLTQSDAVPYLEVGFNSYRQPEFVRETNEWRVQYSKSCIDYSGEIPDIYWNAARIFAFMALVFGGGGALFLWFSSCFVFGPGTWRWAGYEILAASIFQTLSFLWFLTSMCTSEGNTCELFFGSKSNIISASLWFVSALSIFTRYPKPSRKLKSGKNNEEESNWSDTENDPANLWDSTSRENNRVIHLDDVTLPTGREFD